MKRGRIPYTADPKTLRDVADSLDEDARRYEDVIRLNPNVRNEGQEWVRDALHRHAKKLRRMALTIENKSA